MEDKSGVKRVTRWEEVSDGHTTHRQIGVLPCLTYPVLNLTYPILNSTYLSLNLAISATPLPYLGWPCRLPGWRRTRCAASTTESLWDRRPPRPSGGRQYSPSAVQPPPLACMSCRGHATDYCSSRLLRMVAAGLSPWTLSPSSPTALVSAKAVLARQADAVVRAASMYNARVAAVPAAAEVGRRATPTAASVFDLQLLNLPGAPMAVFMRAYAQVRLHPGHRCPLRGVREGRSHVEGVSTFR